MTDRDDLLHEVIEGRLPQGRLDLDSARMARIAALSRRIELPGPSAAGVVRMNTRFEAMLEGRQSRTPAAWLLGWIGAGPRPRALAQRFAAATLAIAATTTTAGAVTGNTPLETATFVAEFAGSAIQNLNPARLDGGGDMSPATPEPSPDTGSIATGTPQGDGTATATPTNTPTGTATSTPTPGQQPGVVGGAVTATPPAASATPPALPSATPSPTAAPPDTPTATPTPDLPTPPPATATPTATPTPPSPTPTSTPSPTPTPTVTPSPTPTGETFDASDAGTVTLRIVGDSLEIVAVTPASGWTVTKKQTSGDEVEIELVKGSRKVEFKAHLEDGEIEVHVEEEQISGDTDGGDD